MQMVQLTLLSREIISAKAPYHLANRGKVFMGWRFKILRMTFLVLLLPIFAVAQSEEYKIEHLTQQDGALYLLYIQ
jgi:hypothetical protein